jgi:hypothetical protein
MHPTSPPPNTSGTAYRETYAYLCSMMPEPADEDAEATASRDRQAMDAVVALTPYDLFEARLAARIVAMDAHCAESLRLAALYATIDPPEARRCRAQAALMARQSDASLRTLKRIHADRDKALAAAHRAATEETGCWFHDAPAPAPKPDPAPEPDRFSRMTEAEQYAVIYPDRAARIRAAGGLPADATFGPPEPRLVRAIVDGTSPILLALDRHGVPEHGTPSLETAS